MSTVTTTVDLADIQAIVLRGFRHIEALPHAYFGFISLGDASSGRALLGRLLPSVTSCADWDAASSESATAASKAADFVLNLGFTPAGLQTLGQDTAQFPPEFRNGMASRAAILGDVGQSAPSTWEQGYRAADLDAVVLVQAKTIEGILAGQAMLECALTAAPEAKLLFAEVGADFPDRAASEHFGFVDGIGQPFIKGSGLTPYPGEGVPEPDGSWAPLETGSFVLGFTDEFGHNDYPDPPFKNGSYIAFRKLQQRVAAFRRFVAQMAAQGSHDEEHEAARLVGRWRSGAPLELAAEADDPTLALDWQRNNDFRYAQDAGGLACPHASHIRRTNPRADSTGPTLQQVREHRIIRRGIAYGPWLPEGAPDDGVDRGLHFLVINASLAHQFEYVQQNWVNGTLSSTALSTEIDRDPIVGSNDGTGKFVALGVHEPTIGWGLERFVEVRGGSYLFVPSLATLHALAS